MTRRIGFLVFPDFQILDLSGPLAAFEISGRTPTLKKNTETTPRPYELHVVSEQGGLVKSSSGLAVTTEGIQTRTFDTLIIAGGMGAFTAATAPKLQAFVKKAARRSRRVTSVCSGAFVVAAAGLLEGRRATTHWRAAPLLKRRYPGIEVDDDRIFIKEGRIWTSAGVTAGIDLALALIEEDLGVEAAKAVARELVVYYRRPGGQSQFSALLELDSASERIRRVLSYARANLREGLSVEQLAALAGLSPRQFGRVFLSETGQTPAKAVERLRAESARARIEKTNEPIEMIAKAAGFSDPERMRRAFVRIFGNPPQAVRRMVRSDR
jgi:transcriptional regulator GlxA family with amidase domain